ncbi:helix-turn-helix transcriptional regulator [Sphingobium indicum]|uniref:helix-turn-helix transcriptional regulator n=1 Tax=Sphingobium indicum TaxID=332055 RepID=UPI0009DA2C3D|nr:AlpA family phage regulatory protein [Sphingobium indicum]
MTTPDRLIRLKEVCEITGLSKTMIYKLLKQGNFPVQYKPGGFSSRWDEAEVRAWRQAQRPDPKT